jgi:hypothetical protein
MVQSNIPSAIKQLVDPAPVQRLTLPVTYYEEPVWLQLLIDVGGEANGPALGYRQAHELADG